MKKENIPPYEVWITPDHADGLYAVGKRLVSRIFYW